MALKSKSAKVVSRKRVQRKSVPKEDTKVAMNRLFTRHDDCIRKGKDFTNNDRKLFGGCPRPGQPGSEEYFTEI